ncbi:MAG: FeoB-associated Cys-rich membrane protein [Bacteroidales bacterium]
MSTQLIIVIIIVAAAFGAAAYKLYRRFFSTDKHGSACSGCSGCSLKNEFKARQKGCFEHPETKGKWTKLPKE